MNTLDIRPATTADQMTLKRINQHAWQAAYAHIYTDEEINDLFSGKIQQHATWTTRRAERLITLAAWQQGQIRGYCGLARLRDGSAEVTSLYVEPDSQGAGIGTALWQRACALLIERGYRQVWVWVLARARAVDFYRAQGCIQTAEGVYTIGLHSEVAHGYTLPLNT